MHTMVICDIETLRCICMLCTKHYDASYDVMDDLRMHSPAPFTPQHCASLRQGVIKFTERCNVRAEL